MDDRSPAQPRVGYVILYVERLEAALSFYTEALGFSLKMKVDQYAELNTGETTLAISERSFIQEHLGISLHPAGQGSSEIGVVYPLDQVDQRFQGAIQAGASVVMEPRNQPWGQRVSYVRDPDGHLVEICSPVSSP